MGKGLKTIEWDIQSIFGGQQATWLFGKDDQFLSSFGIDPELSVTSLTKPSGVIFPTVYAEFSGEYLQGAPLWISGAQTSSGVYVYDSGGTVVTYSNLYAGEVGLVNIPNSAGNGMAIYNDYIYCANASTIYRGGRLSQTAPTFMNYWIDTLAMSALSQPDYPATRNVYYPNHVLYPHNDGYLYVLDYDGANGRVHALITSSDGTSGSGEFNVLTLPLGMLPFAAAPLGTDMAIVASPQSNFVAGGVPLVGHAKMFLWDTVRGNKFYKAVDIGENLATAIVNKNGVLYVTAGSLDGGFKILRYLGGDSFSVEAFVPESSPPFAGAIDVKGNMLAVGAFASYPIPDAGVVTLGFRDARIDGNAINNIARSNATSGSLPVIGALKFLKNNGTPTIGWRTDTTYGLDNIGTGTYRSVWFSRVFNINRPAVVKRLLLALTEPLATGMSIEIDFYVEHDTNSYGDGQFGLRDINLTNFSAGEQLIDLKDLTIPVTTNFYFKLSFTGTTEVGVSLPIHIEAELLDA